MAHDGTDPAVLAATIVISPPPSHFHCSPRAAASDAAYAGMWTAVGPSRRLCGGNSGGSFSSSGGDCPLATRILPAAAVNHGAGQGDRRQQPWRRWL